MEAMLHRGHLPNVITYNALISACEKGTLPQSALQLLEAMLHQGLRPGVIAYNALVSTCEKGKETCQAFNVCAVMSGMLCHPAISCMTSFLLTPLSVLAERALCCREPYASGGNVALRPPA